MNKYDLKVVNKGSLINLYMVIFKGLFRIWMFSVLLLEFFNLARVFNCL